MRAPDPRPTEEWSESVPAILELGRYFQKLRTEHPNKKVVEIVSVQYGLDRSAIGKICKLVNHPIISDPKYSDKLPGAWGLLYELTFIEDKILLEKLEKNEVLYANKYKIWDWRGVKKKLVQETSPANSKVIVPDNISLVAYVNAGMRREDEFNGEAEGVAKALKIGVQTYRMIRSIIVLMERPELTEADRKLVSSIIEKINKTRNVRPHYEKIKPLIDKVWGESPTKILSKKLYQKRVDRYMNAVAILVNSCESLHEMEVPYLSSQNLDSLILDLTEAGKLVRALAENLRRLKNAN